MTSLEMTAPLIGRQGRGPALATVLAVLFLTFLDTTIVSVTLGDLETDLNAGVIPLQWVINGYALVFAALMLLGGSLGDRLGRRRMMLVGIAVFAAGSLMCALAASVTLVIAGRAVMGVGAAASEPGTLSIIRQLFGERALRARALGAWSAVSGLALALGPVIGGVLVGLAGWRAIFWFNLVVALLLLVAVLRTVPESRDPHPGRLDLAGFALGTAGIALIIYAAIEGEYRGYASALIVTLFVLGAVCLVAFVPTELRAHTPMLDLREVRRPIVGSALFAAFAVYFGVFAIFFFTALYLDVAKNYSGLKLAAMFAPMAVAIVVSGLLAGRWVARVGTRTPTVVGCVVAALGMLIARFELARGNGLTFAVLAAALAVAGIGFGTTVVPLTSAVLSHVPARRSGMAASATNTARQLGAVFGVAILGAVVNAHLVNGLKSLGPYGEFLLPTLETGGGAGSASLALVPDALLRGFRQGLQTALLMAIVLILLAGALAAVVREPPPLPDD